MKKSSVSRSDVITKSSFSAISDFPRDEAFGCVIDYTADTCPYKVNLGAGLYRDESSQPWVLPSVKMAERMVLEDPTLDHEYLPIRGHEPFVAAAQALVFGTEVAASFLSRVATIQTISGTGANHTGARFLKESLCPRAIWLPDPTWPNHHIIWDLISPAIERRTYPYYSPQTRYFDFEGMISTLEAHGQSGDVILLHACAHNPTGLDPTHFQWQQIASLCQRKHLFPLFDAAYLGFATGSPIADAWSMRYFATLDIEFGVAQSFSKNFGLYGERVGAFHLVTRDKEARGKAMGLLMHIQRGEISTPPAHGSKIVATVLGCERLKTQWESDLKEMSGRIMRMREDLYEELSRLGTPGNWEHIVNQVGMFSYTGLTSEQVFRLKTEFHIYMLASGRASVSGLNEQNVGHVARAFDIVIREARQVGDGLVESKESVRAELPTPPKTPTEGGLAHGFSDVTESLG